MKAPRVILFKAKRTDNKKWVEGYYIYHIKRTPCVIGDCVKPEDEQHVIMHDGFSDWNMPRGTVYYEIDPTTLSQFTGWKDSHGQRIFENDIVEIVSSPTRSEKYLIWWNREMNVMTAISFDGIEYNGTDYYNHTNYHFTYEKTFCLMMQDPWGDFRDVKVVGNLFDNPELLEGANE